MIQVTIIGSGNVAQHLIKAFRDSKDALLVQVVARHPENLHGLLPSSMLISDFNAILPADLYIICVSDSAISEVSAKIRCADCLVAHTAGSIPTAASNGRHRRGVFYPLQTFSKSREIDFSEVPICITSEKEKDLEILRRAASAISGNVHEVDDLQRKSLHVAAVFASNFVNHMLTISESICNRHNVPFDILKPLILETAVKAMEMPPRLAQTGPAIRKDKITIDKHLDLLLENHLRDVYKTITKSISTWN